VANVTLIDENAASASLDVTVTGTSDGAGFVLSLSRGTDNAYRGSFGFSTGATDNTSAPKVIKVSNGDTVAVTYRDANPPSTKSASAIWKNVYPFEDSLLIGGCFIATAAYGSPMAPEVMVFRRFRDEVLQRSEPGRMLVDVYYRVSPPLAKYISGRPLLRSAARGILVPAALLAHMLTGASLAENIMSFCIVMLIPGLLFLFPRRKLARRERFR
jgi:hypothetical protein